MKNYEKYADKIREYNNNSNFCSYFIVPYILKSDSCGHVTCEICRMLQMIWLMEDYEEPETDWSEVKVDTPILVRNTGCEDWYRRYFAEYRDGNIYAWVDGRTSWTGAAEAGWDYAKLAESEEK